VIEDPAAPRTRPGDDPASRPTDTEAKPAWYRRRALLVGVVVVAVVAVTVVTDLPQHTSRASDVAAANAVIAEVNTDMAPCTFAANESFTIYGDESHGTLAPGDRSRVPGLLRDDQVACSFTNESIYALSDIDLPGASVGKDMGTVVSTVTLWATSDALGAIEAIQTLSTKPTDHAALTELASSERMLAADRSATDAAVHAAGTLLHATLSAVTLPVLPTPGAHP